MTTKPLIDLDVTWPWARCPIYSRPRPFDYRTFRDVPPFETRTWGPVTVRQSIWGKLQEDAPGSHGDWRGTDVVLRLPAKRGFGKRSIHYERSRAPLTTRAIDYFGRRYRLRLTWEARWPIARRYPYQQHD